jgi:hypothetical protein
MSEPVYIVSGYPRSGTSMMMRALIAGGLDAAHRDTRNAMARRASDDDYQPNPENELFELHDWEYRAFGFPLAFTGKLIKAVTVHARNLDVVPGGTRVVFMRRDPEEIRQSYLAFFPARRPPTVEEIVNDVEWTLRQMRDRRSFDLVEFGYRDVLECPFGHFAELAGRGWPIDPVVAAKVVDPARIRYRAEALTAGVR